MRALADVTVSHYSGRFNVRLGEQLHRDLATQAADDGMTLNQYVVKRLAAP